MMEIPQYSDDAPAHLKVVKVAFEYNRIKYDQFLKLLKYLRAGRIDIRGTVATVKELLKGHADLILGFNTSMPTGKKLKKGEEKCELPWDVLNIISKTLDFDDMFQFASVSKNWRAFHKIYWTDFLASRKPLLLQISYNVKESYSFINISDQEVCHLEMMKHFPRSTYVTSSSRYFIMTKYNNSFMLINPFGRIKKVINTPTFEVSCSLTNRALLAFFKCFEEFVLVVLCKLRLHVYQSRNCGWVTYSTMENPEEWVVDFVVLHNIIYVVTNKANIGVLSLNSANIKFLNLKSTPNVTSSLYLRLVNCDEQLLVVDLVTKEIRNVYKIDFSTMNYVKLETLGDIALFSISNGFKRNCYALSNPSRLGYESNCVYAISLLSTICNVYSWDDKKLQNCITLPAPKETRGLMVDWCFRNLHYEVDYSLVE